MKALVTGAGSGIGREIARELSRRGCSLILVSRRAEPLEELRGELGGDTRAEPCDLSGEEACFALYDRVRGEGIDILVNCAGCGVFGPFLETDLRRELEMLGVNVRAVHILTKLFCRDFSARGSGFVLNVASSAAFQPGPLFSSYYASKAYVLRLTEALNEELRRAGSGVYAGAFCPGPVDTAFGAAAGVKQSLPGLSARRAAKLAVDGMFARKAVIVPGFGMRAALFFERFLPERAVLRITWRIQSRKTR